MKKRIDQFVLLIVFLFSLGSLSAQENSGLKPLAQVIGLLETQYHVQFNYAEDTVSGISLKPPETSLSFKEALEYIQKATGLLFTDLNSGIVLVTQNKTKVLCGYVKDIETSYPLSGTTIQTIKSSTTTDDKGFFKIEIYDVSEPITIRYLGYKTINKSYNLFVPNQCDTVFLTPNFQSLSQVVISNYLVNGINKINNGSFEINFSDFDILPGLIETDVLQSIQSLPGIQSINETVSNINIRGGTHDQNLILWDDIKMYQSGHFFGLISMYNPQITHKVSLRKNGSDVSFTDGVSGTIEMQTNKNITTKFTGIVGVNLTNINGFIDFPVGKKSSVQIAARKSINDFIETPTYKSFFNRISQNTEVEDNQTSITNSNKSFDFYDTSLRWLYNVSDKDQLRLNFINVYNELLFNENAIINEQLESKESRLTQNSIASGINYKRIWSDALQSTFEIYETDYKLKSINANILDSQRFLQENAVSETSVKLKADYKINDRFHLLNGYHFVETEVTNLDDVDNPLLRLLVSEVLRAHGLFSELEYRSLNKNTNLNFGIRYNYLEKFKKQLWEPRLSFSQKFLTNFTWEILGEFKHQNTSQVINFQSDFLGIEKRRWQLSNNEDIPIIKSKQISTGLNYSNKGWLFNIEGYYKRVNGITSQSQGFQNQYEFSKSNGSYNAKGFDILFRKRIDKFNCWVSYSFMENTYTFKEYQERSFPSNFNITHAVTLGTAYSFKKLKISTGFNWHSGKPTTTPINSNEIVNYELYYGDTNGENLKGYMRLDVSALYDFKIGNKTTANLGVSVWNVLNRENEISNFYRVNDDGIINETVQNSLGITPNAVFRLYF